MRDPDREALLAYLYATAETLPCDGSPHAVESCQGDCAPCFDIEEAAYYLAAHYHGGQWSRLYAALCASPFKPGPTMRDLPDPEERFQATVLYEAGAAWIEQGHTPRLNATPRIRGRA